MGKSWKNIFDNAKNSIESGEKLYEELSMLRNNNTDFIICPAHMGDTIWVAALARDYIRTHSCDEVWYVVRASQAEMVRHFPDINSTVELSDDEMRDLERYIIVMKLFGEEHIRYAYLPAVLCIDSSSIYKVEYNDQLADSTMLERDIAWLGITGEVNPSRMMSVDDGNDEELKERFSKAVLLMPVCQTLQNIPMSFWKKLADEYALMGYTVYTNYNGFPYERMIDGTLELASSIMELAKIGPYFSQIISQRSGACDLLAQVNTNLSILYYRQVDIAKVRLREDELGVENIYKLIDRKHIFNYQYIEGLEETLIRALVEQLALKNSLLNEITYT